MKNTFSPMIAAPACGLRLQTHAPAMGAKLAARALQSARTAWQPCSSHISCLPYTH